MVVFPAARRPCQMALTKGARLGQFSIALWNRWVTLELALTCQWSSRSLTCCLSSFRPVKASASLSFTAISSSCSRATLVSSGNDEFLWGSRIRTYHLYIIKILYMPYIEPKSSHWWTMVLHFFRKFDFYRGQYLRLSKYLTQNTEVSEPLIGLSQVQLAAQLWFCWTESYKQHHKQR